MALVWAEVKAHLADEHWDPPALHLTNSPGIVVEVARREALVGAVEEGKVLLGENHIHELSPLLLGRVNTLRDRKSSQVSEPRMTRIQQ